MTRRPRPAPSRRQTPLSHSFCQHVVDLQAPMVLPDARLYPRVRENLAVPELGVVAYAGMPLTDLDGRVQILQGLRGGERVVVYSHKALDAGSRIKVVDRIMGKSS